MTVLEVQIENNRLRSGALVVRRFGDSRAPCSANWHLPGVQVDAGESGARVRKGAGASASRRLRAFFVRSKRRGCTASSADSEPARVHRSSEREDQLSQTRRSARRRWPHSQPRIVHLPAQPLLRYSRSQGSLLPFDPSWCLSAPAKRVCLYLSLSTTRRLSTTTHPPPPPPPLITSLRQQLQLQRAHPSPLLLLPLSAACLPPACRPRCLSEPRAAALPARPPGFACIAAFARAPAATHHSPTPPARE